MEKVSSRSEQEVLEWLKTMNCECYAERLFAAGCDSMEAIQCITKDDLNDFGVKPFHQRIMLKRMNPLHLTSSSPTGTVVERSPVLAPLQESDLVGDQLCHVYVAFLSADFRKTFVFLGMFVHTP